MPKIYLVCFYGLNIVYRDGIDNLKFQNRTKSPNVGKNTYSTFEISVIKKLVENLDWLKKGGFTVGIRSFKILASIKYGHFLRTVFYR